MWPAWSATSEPTAAPTPASANWPSDSWPDRPVTTPTDNPTIAYARTMAVVMDVALVAAIGTISPASAAMPATIQPRLRIVHRRRSREGNGGQGCTAAQLPRGSARPRS